MFRTLYKCTNNIWESSQNTLNQHFMGHTTMICDTIPKLSFIFASKYRTFYRWLLLAFMTNMPFNRGIHFITSVTSQTTVILFFNFCKTFNRWWFSTAIILCVSYRRTLSCECFEADFARVVTYKSQCISSQYYTKRLKMKYYVCIELFLVSLHYSKKQKKWVININII